MSDVSGINNVDPLSMRNISDVGCLKYVDVAGMLISLIHQTCDDIK